MTIGASIADGGCAVLLICSDRGGSGRRALEMATLPDLVGLADPACELVVELIVCADAELMHEQALGVRGGAADAGVFDAPLQVQVPVEAADGGLGAGEPPPAALERDRRLGDGVLEWTARFDQLDEPVIERDHRRRLATQVVIHCPYVRVHAPQRIGSQAGPSPRHDRVASAVGGAGRSTPAPMR